MHKHQEELFRLLEIKEGVKLYTDTEINYS